MTTIDLCDPRTFDDPSEIYRRLRDVDGFFYDEANDLYAIARYEDVRYVSSNPQIFSSGVAGARPAVPAKLSILDMDDPDHVQQRRLISRGFTPRIVREMAPRIREITQLTIDQIASKGEIDFVEDFAIHVPLIVIAEMMGLDPESRLKLYRWSDLMIAGDGHMEADSPELLGAMTAFGEYTAVCQQLIDDRRENPANDLISTLTQAYDEGALGDGVPAARLEDDELLMFLALLVVAGNETTRNAISGGLRAFSQFPAEREKLVQNPELIDLAVEEIVRFVTPVLSFSRTVTEDHSYGGHDFKEGDRVLMLYGAANRDEREFDDPDTFLIDRDPTHIGFGIGPHFCLGANLARAEVKIVFEELFGRLHDIRVTDPSAPLDRSDSTLVAAIKSLPAVFTPA